MKKPLKIAATLFGLFIALPIIAISLALLIIDPNEYKPQIEALVQEQTGRELSIDGDIKLSIFPWLGIELGRITLTNASGFTPDAFAKIEHAKVKVHLVPLLSKEVEVSAITLSGLELNLAKDKTGKTNWADLTQTDASPQDLPTTSAPSPGSSADDATNIAALTVGIGGVHIENATLNWHDETTNTQHSIQGLNLTTGGLFPGKPIDIELDFALNSNQPPVNAQVEFSANIEPDLNNIKHRINSAALRVTFNAKDPVASGEITLDSDIFIDMEKQRVELPQLKITSLLDLVNGDLKTKSKLKATIVYNISKELLSITQTNLNILATGMDFPPEGVALHSTTQAELDLQQQTLDINPLTLSVADLLHLSASLQGTSIVDNPHLTGELAIAPFNPRHLLQALGQAVPQTQSDQVLNHAELNLSIDAKPNLIKLSDIIFRLDQSTLTSELQVKNLDNPAPAIMLNASLDHFNLDHYLPPTEETETTTPPTNTAATEPMSLEPIRALNLDGQINIGELTASNLKVSDIAITLKADKGKINIHPLKARLYEGHYSGDIQLNAQGDTLSTSLNETLTGIQAGPFLKDLIDNDLLQGKGDLKLKLSADGLDVDEIMQTLTGNVAILFRDGAVNGFNLGKILRDARARLQGKEISKDDVSKTDFAELSASLELKEGVAHNSDLKFKSPLLRLTGKGDIYYIKQTLNYLATVTIVGTSKGQGGKEMAELKGLPIDVKIKGTFTEPKFKVDLASALKARAKAKAKEKAAAAKQKLNTKLNESKEKLNDKLEDELKNQLKKIF